MSFFAQHPIPQDAMEVLATYALDNGLFIARPSRSYEQSIVLITLRSLDTSADPQKAEESLYNQLTTDHLQVFYETLEKDVKAVTLDNIAELKTWEVTDFSKGQRTPINPCDYRHLCVLLAQQKLLGKSAPADSSFTGGVGGSNNNSSNDLSLISHNNNSNNSKTNNKSNNNSSNNKSNNNSVNMGDNNNNNNSADAQNVLRIHFTRDLTHVDTQYDWSDEPDHGVGMFNDVTIGKHWDEMIALGKQYIAEYPDEEEED